MTTPDHPVVPYAHLPSSTRLRYTEAADGTFIVEVLPRTPWQQIWPFLAWLIGLPAGGILVALIAAGWQVGYRKALLVIVDNWIEFIAKAGPIFLGLLKVSALLVGIFLVLTISFSIRQTTIRLTADHLEIEEQKWFRVARWKISRSEIAKISRGSSNPTISIWGSRWRLIALRNPSDADWLAQRLRSALQVGES